MINLSNKLEAINIMEINVEKIHVGTKLVNVVYKRKYDETTQTYKNLVVEDIADGAFVVTNADGYHRFIPERIVKAEI